MTLTVYAKCRFYNRKIERNEIRKIQERNGKSVCNTLKLPRIEPIQGSVLD